MARGVNKAILLGRLGQEPELRYSGSGKAVCNMRLATDESYTDRDGNDVEKTEWHNVVAWEKLAEVCNEHLSKGSQIFVEGKLQTRSWEDRDGNTRYTTEVKAREVKFLGGEQQAPEGEPQQEPEPKGQPQDNGEEEQFEPDDELPF